MRDDAYPDALPAGHRLLWYALERVLGQGGFGITYLAHDTNLDRRVAIKEYLPTEIARRRSDAAAHPRTEAQAERYTWGLERFLAEARTLARFVHPHIVQVHSVFEANNTAYMVMRYEEGESLAQLLDRCGTLGEQQLTGCLLPVLDGLQLVHSAGFIHRDIKPANIYMRQDGSPVLLDFGSARQSFGISKTMTILVAPGYAPLEQYYSEADTQGAWTDIYSLGATCYRAIAGRAPLEAVARAKGVLGSARDVLEPATEVGRGRYSERLLAAVDHALQLSEKDRPQDIASWRRELLGNGPTTDTPPMVTPMPAPPAARSPSQSPSPVTRAAAEPEPAAPARSAGARLLWPAVATAAALAGVSAFVIATRTQAPVPVAAPRSEQAMAPAPAARPTPPGTDPSAVAMAPAAVQAPAVAAPPAAAPVPTPAPGLPSTRAGNPSARAVARPSPPPVVNVAPPVEVPAPAAPSPAAPPTITTVAATVPATRVPDARSLRNEQIDAGEAALRRGDHAAAAQLLLPWAEAGVPRAQALLGRVKETRPGGEQSNFEAYVWYSIAARGGEAGAVAQRDKVAARLQAAEIRQAEHTVDRWRPRPEAASAAGP